MAALAGFINNVDWVLAKDILVALSTPVLILILVCFLLGERRRRVIVLADRRQVVLMTAMRLTGYLIAEGTRNRLDVRAIARDVADGSSKILSSLYLFASDYQWRLVTLSKKAYEISALVTEAKGEHTKEIDDMLNWFKEEESSTIKRLCEIRGQVASLAP